MIKPIGEYKALPFKVVGSTVFGRYPKISVEQTFNMIISDEWLVPFAGHKKVASISEYGPGRGIFPSVKAGFMVVVIEDGVYRVSTNLTFNLVGNLSTFSGDVFIDENDANQIAICDQTNIYIYNYIADTFTKVTLDFIPGYLTFQDGYFIAPDTQKSQWRLSALNDGMTWGSGSANIGLFQTKPDIPVACVRFPGRGGSLLVMGHIVTEVWTDVGYNLFPYQRASSFNIDYGCLNPSTIATGDTFVIWLATNEKSGPVIMYSSGSDATQISNDGINFKLASLVSPQSSYASIVKQDGHLLYLLTFTDPHDDFTLVYDFNTQKFFTLTDEYTNYHIAKKIVFFNDKYYFISLRDGSLYEMSSNYTNYDGNEVPRIRVCETLRMPDSSGFIVNSLEMLTEQGDTNQDQRIDISVSRDGGVSFGSYVGMNLNRLAHRKNKFVIWSLGYCNEFTPQFRFWGQDRFLVNNGSITVFQ